MKSEINISIEISYETVDITASTIKNIITKMQTIAKDELIRLYPMTHYNCKVSAGIEINQMPKQSWLPINISGYPYSTQEVKERDNYLASLPDHKELLQLVQEYPFPR